jgi:hypothetical protein
VVLHLGAGVPHALQAALHKVRGMAVLQKNLASNKWAFRRQRGIISMLAYVRLKRAFVAIFRRYFLRSLLYANYFAK